MASNIPVLYEDAWIAIVEKPPGLLTVPAPGRQSRTLEGILNEELKATGAAYRLYPCHRLDKETSGAIMFAKGKSAQQAVMELFRQRKIKKTYLAFVHGTPAQEHATISKAIEGKPAKTQYRILERTRQFSVVEVQPETGRTNQIRIHFRSIGHPLVGESTFAFRKDFMLRAKRACLHAVSLEFVHPFTKKTVHVESRMARDMQAFLGKSTAQE